jgi:hypothetical protein
MAVAAVALGWLSNYVEWQHKVQDRERNTYQALEHQVKLHIKIAELASEISQWRYYPEEARK